MKEPEDLGEDDLGFGSWQRQEGVPRSVAAEVLDKVLGDDDSVAGLQPQEVVAQGRRYAEILPHAVNQATMCCSRGPCVHLWALTARSAAQIRGSKRINITRVRQCNAHYEPTELSEANIYECGLWWPAPLSFVPESLRSMLRPHLHRTWNAQLKLRGYDFSWKWWDDNVFEKDKPEDRGKTLPIEEQGLYFDK